jgi:hypothetical protein
MADTVDTAASPSPAGDAEAPQVRQAGDPEEPHRATLAGGTEEPRDARSGSREDEQEQREQGAEEPQDAGSVTELLEQLSRELSELGKAEARLEAARNMPEVRRSARDVAGALLVAVAALTAFALLNVAAVDRLSNVLATWLAALVIATVWLAVAGLLLFGLMGRARRWLLWLLLKQPSTKDVAELRRERDSAAEATRGTLELLGPALLIRIALAAVPEAGDVASGVVEAGDNVLDASDEIVADFTEEIPGGGAVRQVWAVALMPGRLGIRVATTVLRRRRPED